jgi:hypothetical protein
MTDPAPRARAATRWRTLLLIAAAVALLAGCELATGTVRTVTELQDAGIRNPNLQYNDGVATLEYDADPNPLEARTEQNRAAAVIWRKLPFRIDRITVIPDGGGFGARRDYPRELLEAQLGSRPANLDRSTEDIARRAALIAVVVGVVVLVLVVVIILLVVRAVRRRPSPPPAGAWPQNTQQPWGQPWPQQGQPGQPAWGQPQPAPPGQQPWGQAGPPGQQLPGQQPWSQPGYGQPPDPGWPAGAPRPEAKAPPRAPQAPAPAPTEPPARGPGDTQRLEPDPPPPADRGPAPPA